MSVRVTPNQPCVPLRALTDTCTPSGQRRRKERVRASGSSGVGALRFPAPALALRECACPPAAAAIHACLRWTAGCTGPRSPRPHNGTMYGHSGRNRRWRVSRSRCGRADCVAAFGDAVRDALPVALPHPACKRSLSASPVRPHQMHRVSCQSTAPSVGGSASLHCACVRDWVDSAPDTGSRAAPIAGCPTGMMMVVRTLSDL